MPCLYPEDITSSRFQSIASPPTSLQTAHLSEDSLNEEQSQVTNTGRSSSASPEQSDFHMSENSSDLSTPSSRDRRQRMIMYGRRRRASRGRSLNLDAYRLREMRQRIGRLGRYYLLTVPAHRFIPFLPPTVAYIRGQLERGTITGYDHWQLLVLFEKTVRISHVRKIFGPFHAELSRSSAANEYVWKEETRIEGTQFELGSLPTKRNALKDWEAIWDAAKRRDIDSIPADVRITWKLFFPE